MSETVFITFPKCGNTQRAEIEFKPWMPFPSQVHECEHCDYMILESEWQEAP